MVRDFIFLMIGGIVGAIAFAWTSHDWKKMFGGDNYFSLKDIRASVMLALFNSEEPIEDLESIANETERNLLNGRK